MNDLQEMVEGVRKQYAEAMSMIKAFMKRDGVDPTRYCKLVFHAQEIMREFESIVADAADLEKEAE